MDKTETNLIKNILVCSVEDEFFTTQEATENYDRTFSLWMLHYALALHAVVHKTKNNPIFGGLLVQRANEPKVEGQDR